MISDEYIDLNTSYCDEEFLSQEFPLSPKQHNEGKCEINKSLTNGNKSTDDEESILLDSSLQSSTSSRNIPDSSVPYVYHNVSQNLSIQSHPKEQSFPKRDSESKSIEKKTAEFRAVLDNVNDAYVRWKMNEFVLEIITKSSSWSKQIKAIIRTSEIQNYIKLQSENGEVSNLLGLGDEDLKDFQSRRTKALINKSAFRENAIGLVKANLPKLKLQKKSIQDEFGAHCMKVRAGCDDKGESGTVRAAKSNRRLNEPGPTTAEWESHDCPTVGNFEANLRKTVTEGLIQFVKNQSTVSTY